MDYASSLRPGPPKRQELGDGRKYTRRDNGYFYNDKDDTDRLTWNQLWSQMSEGERLSASAASVYPGPERMESVVSASNN